MTIERNIDFDESGKKNLFILDIDNVLNTDDHIRQINEEAGIETGQDFQAYFPDHMEEYLDPKRVQRLDDCLDQLAPDPHIVLCSTWQKSGLKAVQVALEAHGFTHTIHQRTHEYFLKLSSNRTEEVQSMIRQIDPDRLVILDDAPAYGSLGCDPDFCFTPHHVQPDDGLTKEHVEAIGEVWAVEFEYESRPIPDPPWEKHPEHSPDDENESEVSDPDSDIQIGDKTISLEPEDES
jgi:hypothetical protein